jgi:hypothetical protein
MGNYMIDISLPEELTDDFQSKIPLQIESVSLHMQSGNIISYTLTMDRLKLWIVVSARNKNDAKSIIKSMPLYSYFDYTIHELMFNNINLPLYTTFSLN